MTTSANKTFRPKKADIIRSWYHIDASGKVVGKVAVKVADLLRGKNKPYFVSNMDCGDFVIVTNLDKIVFTGNKEAQKQYISHSGYKGHMKSISPAELRVTGRTQNILIEAVKGMIPPNKLRDGILEKLKIFTGDTHTHEAQKPVTIEV